MVNCLQDGDEFGIIWDKNIFLQAHEIHSPAVYATPTTPKPPNTEYPVNDQLSLAHFFLSSMANDAIGKVANIHLALCDMLPGTNIIKLVLP